MTTLRDNGYLETDDPIIAEPSHVGPVSSKEKEMAIKRPQMVNKYEHGGRLYTRRQLSQFGKTMETDGQQQLLFIPDIGAAHMTNRASVPKGRTTPTK